MTWGNEPYREGLSDLNPDTRSQLLCVGGHMLAGVNIDQCYFSVVGRFADLFGARAAMCLSCTASVVYYGLLAIADSPLMLFIHKLPAVLMHGLPGKCCTACCLSNLYFNRESH
jgi:hypothetical protein